MEEQVDQVFQDLTDLTAKVSSLKAHVLCKLEDKTRYISQLEKQLSNALHEKERLIHENELLREKLAKLSPPSDASKIII
uniref:Uncharacterized protein n=1 Tax=Panagrolaimus sp. JU765 TaxID=591449 RepID=A0AC34R3D5_9BILA